MHAMGYSSPIFEMGKLYLATSGNRPKFIPSRREFLGTLFAGVGGAAVGAALPDFGDDYDVDNITQTDEQFAQLSLRGKLQENLRGQSIEESDLDRLIEDFENFEAKFDALIIGQGTALTYNLTASDYFEECIEDRQFQILMLPLMVNYGVFEMLHLYNFENYANEDWKAEIEQEYDLTYLQANLALKTLDNHIRDKGVGNVFLALATGAAATLSDKLHQKFIKGNSEIPKGPWE